MFLRCMPAKAEHKRRRLLDPAQLSVRCRCWFSIRSLPPRSKRASFRWLRFRPAPTTLFGGPLHGLAFWAWGRSFSAPAIANLLQTPWGRLEPLDDPGECRLLEDERGKQKIERSLKPAGPARIQQSLYPRPFFLRQAGSWRHGREASVAVAAGGRRLFRCPELGTIILGCCGGRRIGPRGVSFGVCCWPAYLPGAPSYRAGVRICRAYDQPRLGGKAGINPVSSTKRNRCGKITPPCSTANARIRRGCSAMSRRSLHGRSLWVVSPSGAIPSLETTAMPIDCCPV